MFKRGENASGGGGIEFCSENEVLKGDTISSFTNGTSVSFTQNVMVIFNCKNYSTVKENTAISINIYGIANGKFIRLYAESGTTPRDISAYDYVGFLRTGNTTSLTVTFA